MANRYWVGGTGSWDATTTNWSATSGGAGGASVPTSVDDVFFNSASNATAYTCTLTTSTLCRSLNVAGPASGNVTIAGATGTTVNGNLTIAATGVTWTYSGGMFFGATTTGWIITTNGVSFQGGISFNGAGGGWTLGGAFTSTSGINILQGTFNTGNFNVTLATNFTLTGALTRAVNLGSSAISALTWNALAATNLTVNAGTSTISLTSTFSGGGLTYYNLTKASGGGITVADGGNTFNALTMNTITTSGTYQCSFAGNQTISTLTINGVSQIARASIQTPNTLAGTQVTLTVGSFVTNGYVDFRDINWQGAASPLTVATGGDGGNNTNITLATQKTVYWNLVAGGTWVSTAWATTSGGTPALANFPLIQDTAIIENTGLTSGNTISLANNICLGTVDMSTRTLPMTFTVGTGGSNIYGNLTLSSAVTCASSTGFLVFTGYNKTQTITSAGVTFESGLQVNNLSTTVTLADALTLGTTRTFTLTLGMLNLNNKNLTCGGFSGTGTLTRAITFGTGQIYATTNNAITVTFNDMTGFTYTGSGIFNCTYSGSTGGRTIIYGNTGGGANETNALNLNVTAGADNIAWYGLGFESVNLTGFAGTWIETGTRTLYGDLTISTGMSITATTSTNFNATSGTQNITSNGKTFTFPIGKNNAGILRLVDALTMGSTLTFALASGTLDLNNNNLTCGLFNTNNSNNRAIAFGTGQIYLTGNAGTIWTFNAGTGLTITGSAIVNATYSGATGTRLLLGYATGTAQINVNITAGTDIVAASNAGFNNVNFTGFTGSVITGVSVTGNMTLGAGMTITSTTAWSMYGTSGTQQFTSNGIAFDAPLTFNGIGGNFQLQDNLTLGSTRTVTLLAGTLNLNGKTLNAGLFSVMGALVKSIAFASGTINVSGATCGISGSNFSTSGSGKISMTSASSKAFNGGGFSYPTLSQDGAGALSITGTNTFDTLTNTVRPATVTLPASTITTVNTLSLNGTVANPITVNSSTSGTRATISKPSGQVGLLNCSIKDILAQGGAKFRASSNYGCTDAGNNSGWDFSALDTKRDNFGFFFKDSIVAH